MRSSPSSAESCSHRAWSGSSTAKLLVQSKSYCAWPCPAVIQLHSMFEPIERHRNPSLKQSKKNTQYFTPSCHHVRESSVTGVRHMLMNLFSWLQSPSSSKRQGSGLFHGEKTLSAAGRSSSSPSPHFPHSLLYCPKLFYTVLYCSVLHSTV